jgi:hypothetical protein
MPYHCNLWARPTMVQDIICKYQGQELFGQPVGILEKQF